MATRGLVGSFRWMHAVELAGGGRMQAYEHRDTRRYLHLDEAAGAWVYVGDERYREVELEHALAAALATWWRGVDLDFERRLGIGSGDPRVGVSPRPPPAPRGCHPGR